MLTDEYIYETYFNMSENEAKKMKEDMEAQRSDRAKAEAELQQEIAPPDPMGGMVPEGKPIPEEATDGNVPPDQGI